MTRPFAYTLFGLRIVSEIELPELTPAEAGEADVTIELGSVPNPPSGDLSVDGASVVLPIPEVARYRISGGSRILVEPEAIAPIRNVRLYLLGSAMGLLLHQRGDLPLHANAVEIGGKAVAFMGRSGAGKSTLAAAFHDRGHAVIADDVCVIRFDGEGVPHAWPGIPRLRLWEEALTATGRSSDAYQLSYAGDENFRKFDVPVKRAGVIELPLAAVYQLGTGDRLNFRPLQGFELAEAIFANTYRGGYLRAVGDPRAHWSAAMRLGGGTPIFLLERPWDFDRISGDLAGIISHAEHVMRSSGR